MTAPQEREDGRAREIAGAISSMDAGYRYMRLDDAARLIEAYAQERVGAALEEAAKIAFDESKSNAIASKKAWDAGREGVSSHRDSDAETAMLIGQRILALKASGGGGRDAK